MATAPDSKGLPRLEENDTGTTGTFSSLLNKILDWVSAVLPDSPTGWVNANTVAVAGSGWNITTLKVKRVSGIVFIAGYASKGSWAAGETVMTLNAPYRINNAAEVQMFIGTSYQRGTINTTGALTIPTAGSGSYGQPIQSWPVG